MTMYNLSWFLPEGRHITEDIDQARFGELERARRRIIAALDIEENYNGLLNRYIEFQQAIARIALEMTVRHGGWVEFRSAGQSANRELICLFSAARQYLDQTDHARSDHFAPELEEFKAWRSEEYDQRPGYRICEALRNLSQHRMLPAQGITVGGKWRDDRTLRDHNAKLRLIPEVIREEDPDFKQRILEELDKLADKDGQVELTPLLRAYLNGVSAIHSKVRKALKSTVDVSIAQLESVRNATPDAWRCEVISIGADRKRKTFSIFPEITEHLTNLRQSNPAHERVFDYEVSC